MIRRTFKPFLTRNQPWITRQSYRYELLNALTFPFALAMVEGSVVGVLAAKAFAVPPFMFATIMASGMFANLTSFVWARLARARRKVRFINLLQMLFLLTVGAIALLPTDGWGPLGLTALIVIGRCLLTGVITLRSTVWRMNYPRNVRAQVTGRLALINTIIVAVGPVLGYGLLDYNTEYFRLIYPGCMLLAFLGVIAYSHIRLRGEKELLRYERTPTAHPQPHGEQAPIYEYDPRLAGQQHRETFWTVLKRDRLFRHYQFHQFTAGASNMAGQVVVIYVIARLTEGLVIAGYGVEYLVSILLTTAIPKVVAVLCLPLWARMLDRMHVVEFRCKQGWFWIFSQSSCWLGAGAAVWTDTIWVPLLLLSLARVIQGGAEGGGILAFNLGHNDFANRRLATLYMGIHVTLTGMRGAFMPFLGIALYLGWNPITLPGTALTLPGYAGMGYHVFLLTTLLAVAAEAGFHHLHRLIRTAHGDALPAD